MDVRKCFTELLNLACSFSEQAPCAAWDLHLASKLRQVMALEW